MSGESDLACLLSNLRPVRQPGTFVFATVPELPTGVVAYATVVEPEGRSIVVSFEDAISLGLQCDYRAAWIRLDVHSALEAVGLTAAVSSALADRGISCNVIAGKFHDHLLVPEDRADEALTVLEQLSPRGATPPK